MFKDIMKPEDFIKKMTDDIDSCNFGGGKISTTDAWKRFLYGKNGNKDAPDEISVCHPLFELYRNLYSLNSEKHAVYACSLIGSTPLNFICHRKQNEGEPEQKELFDAMFNHERYTTLKMNFRARFEENINIFIGGLDDKLKSLHFDKDLYILIRIRVEHNMSILQDEAMILASNRTAQLHLSDANLH